MSVSANWFDNQHEIVLYIFDGLWSWDEMYKTYHAAIAMETSVPHRVDVILDMRKSKAIPANALLHVKNISDKQPDNLGLTVVVTPNGFVRALYNAGVRFYKGIAHYFRVVPTVEDALQMIAEDRRLHDNQPIGHVGQDQRKATGAFPAQRMK
jgi:hypothetical protein